MPVQETLESNCFFTKSAHVGIVPLLKSDHYYFLSTQIADLTEEDPPHTPYPPFNNISLFTKIKNKLQTQCFLTSEETLRPSCVLWRYFHCRETCGIILIIFMWIFLVDN